MPYRADAVFVRLLAPVLKAQAGRPNAALLKDVILLVPQTNGPPGDDLARELDDWQALAEEAWAAFPYEE